MNSNFDSVIDDGPIRILAPSVPSKVAHITHFSETPSPSAPISADAMTTARPMVSPSPRWSGRWQATPDTIRPPHAFHENHTPPSHPFSTAPEEQLAFADVKSLTDQAGNRLDESRHRRHDKALPPPPPRLESRQISNSSDEAVAPTPQLSPMMMTTTTTRVLNDDHNDMESSPLRSSKARTVVFENLNSGAVLGEQPPPQSHSKDRAGSRSDSDISHRPIGLTYALRRTDSGSTFQSLDGLSNSYPLIRKEARRLKEEQRRTRSTRDKRGRQRTSKKRPSGSSTHHRSSSRNDSRYQPMPGQYYFDTSTLACFSTTAWFPLDTIIPQGSYCSMGSKRSPSMSSLQYQEEQQRTKHKHNSQLGASKQLSTREELLRLKLQLRELRRMAGPHAKATTETPIPPPRPHKGVRFSAPLVTQITYRPYTEPEDIALLFFQEEELEALECDREEVSGDQFECQFDEAIMTVRIAYQKQTSVDE